MNSKLPRFPVELRKMWTGNEVQTWLYDNVYPILNGRSIKKHYTGIGSRLTPGNIIDLIKQYSHSLSKNGYVLRSGGAIGADIAFESASLTDSREIYLPWRNFNRFGYEDDVSIVACDLNNYDEAIEIAKRIHPAWNKLNEPSKLLHTRNVYQVLGKDLSTPSEFLVCWANVDIADVPIGGTRTAYVLAKELGVPTYNLYFDSDRKEFEDRFINHLER